MDKKARRLMTRKDSKMDEAKEGEGMELTGAQLEGVTGGEGDSVIELPEDNGSKSGK